MNNDIEIIKQGNPPKGKFVGTCKICGCKFAVDSTRLLQGPATRWSKTDGTGNAPAHPCPQHGCGNTLVCMKPDSRGTGT